MYAPRLTPLHASHRQDGPLGIIGRPLRLVRPRVVALLLAATAVAAIGAPLLGRLASDEAHMTRPPAPAEPGLFDFPQVRQDVPPPVAAAPAAAAVSARPAAAPPARLPMPVAPPALPAGVERFDACVPACDSRDPARTGARSMPLAPARPGGLLPPRGVGEGMAEKSEPGLMERTVNATREAVTGAASHMADQMKSLIGAN